ncbi:MAG: response regulator transcription factor [Coriobacteriales bacterium]|nr:response regulator transcription factor [Coriobacteriales bacterium]
MKIMLIDDDSSLQTLLEQIVRRKGYDYCCAVDGESGMEMLRREKPDLLLLDVMLPDVNGYEICERIRSERRKIPIMFLTAKGDIVDKSIGFKAGADDYLVKPFSHEELMLRIGALLRRRARRDGDGPQHNSEKFVVGDLEILFGKYEVLLRGKPVALSSREFELLEFLASDPGSVFTRDEIIDQAWGDKGIADPDSVTVVIRKIREKIEKDPSKPRYLVTVWRVGYKLVSHL